MKKDPVRSLYIVSKAKKSGSMLIALGMTELLMRHYGRIAVFRPLVAETKTRDSDLETLIEHFSLSQPYDSAVGLSLEEAETLLSEGKSSELIEDLIARFNALRAQYDFVLCEGLADETLAQLIDFDLNVEIAKNFAAPIIGVLSAKGLLENELRETLRLWQLAIAKQGAELFMLFANRCDRELYERYRGDKTICPSIETPVIILPDVTDLDRPNVHQIVQDLGAEVLIGRPEQLQRLTGQPRIAAMHLEHFLARLQTDDLVIAPADRSDIILGAMVANFADNFPAVSAILLTGDLTPARTLMALIRGIEAIHIPLLHLSSDTMETAAAVGNLAARIDGHAPKKIATALGVFHANVDTDVIAEKIAAATADIVTPAMFEYRLLSRAAKEKKRIVLPETDDERILRAADILLRRRAVDILLPGSREKILARATALGISLEHARFIDPEEASHKKQLAKSYYRLRKHKGMTLEAAYDAMSNPTLFATMMVYEDECDGMVSGATHTTRETILPALQTIKTKPGFSIVSSCFFMCFDTRVLLYADCAVNPDPTASELAEIAIASAQTAKQFGIEPRIAMLSYSTGASGVGSDVDKVREATAIVKARAPKIPVDGPMQYDAAIDPAVGAKKMPGSPVAGQATVFIFPDLNTGNNTYKAVQRSAGAVAVGPVLQGLNKPVNDLSRGARVTDIVNTVAITAIQAQRNDA